MTGSASVTFLRSEFDAFLFAPIGEDNNNGMQLSVLSALARQDVDPWEEAARLACLPSETAAQKLASLIAELPGGRSGPLDPAMIAARLVALLPRKVGSGIGSGPALLGIKAITQSWPVKHVVIYVIAVALMLLVQWLIASHLMAMQIDKVSTPIPGTGLSLTPPPTPVNDGQRIGSLTP